MSVLRSLLPRARAIAQTGVLSLAAWFGARALCNLAVPHPIPRASAAASRVRVAPIPRRTGNPSTVRPAVSPVSPTLPLCADVDARITSVASDPRRSLATLRVAGEPHAAPSRVGDRVGRRTLVHIGYDGRHATPVAVLAGQGRACRVLLAAGPARPAARSTTPSTPASDGVRGLLHGVRFVPERGGALRLSGVRPGSALSLLGLDDGDRIESVNGLSLVDPEQALRLYARLPHERELRVRIRRRGAPMTLVIHLV